MTTTDLAALLGPAYDETTPAQRAAIVTAAEAIDARWPDPDLADTRTVALSAALQVVLGYETDAVLAADWHYVRAAERAAHARMTGAIIAGALLDPAESEVARAARLNVTRPTLRKALAR